MKLRQHHPSVPVIDTEKEFDYCVSVVGGIKINECLRSFPHLTKNADYLFSEHKVIVELKCLVEDKGQDARIRAKVSELYEECLRAGKAPIRVFGTCRISTEGFPEDFKRRMAELYRGPIQRRILKANRQIRETKRQVGDDYYGLLFLVNDGHSFLDPGHVMWMVAETFRRSPFSSIDGLVFLTVNLPATHPAHNRDLLVWLQGDLPERKKCPEAFLTRIRQAWFNRVNEVTGLTIPVISASSSAFLGELKNTPRPRSTRTRS